MVSNCLLYTRSQQRQFGGYVVCHQSIHGWWQHRYHTQDFIVFSTFESGERLQRLYRWLGSHKLSWLPPIVFSGTIKLYTHHDLYAKHGIDKRQLGPERNSRITLANSYRHTDATLEDAKFTVMGCSIPYRPEYPRLVNGRTIKVRIPKSWWSVDQGRAMDVTSEGFIPLRDVRRSGNSAE